MTVGDFDGGTLGFELLGNGLHIGHVRAEKYRFTKARRLQNIVAADIGTRLPPTKAISARAKKSTSSPTVSSKQDILAETVRSVGSDSSAAG